MSIFSSYKKIFLLGFIVVILLAIPLSVYIAQQRQRTTSQAAKSTTLSFEPASSTVEVGNLLTLGIILDPGTGSTANQVSFVKLSISFDSAKFATVSGSLCPENDSLCPNSSSPNTLTSVLENPVYTSGKATISLSIGADPTKVVTAKTKIAILQLKALAVTNVNNPSSITFDSAPNTQVLSIAGTDQTSENVLSTTTPAAITINPASVSQSPTPTITAILTTTPTPLPGSIPSPTPTGLSTGSATLTPTPIVVQPTPTITVLPPKIILPPTGPGEKMLGIGIIGAILTLIGGALFILL